MKLTGVFAPIPTPFDQDDRPDTNRLCAALAKWIARPLTGFVLLGSNGVGMGANTPVSFIELILVQSSALRARG